MAYKSCGYLRETVHEAGFNVVTIVDDEMILENMETGQLELWAKSPHYAGYAIEFLNTQWEFIRNVKRL